MLRPRARRKEMGFWDRVLASLKKASGEREDPMAYWVYARCERCGEPLQARVYLRNDPSAEFGETRDTTVYVARKVLIGSRRCYAPVEVKLTFDARRKLLKREIEGGSFLTQEEYLSEAAHARE
jgi:hypothetical protein